jgi:hypothetical protein
MNTAIALELIPCRMQEMGFGDRYRTSTRTLLVDNGKPLRLDLWNAWAWFPSDIHEKGGKITVESNFGLLDLDSGTHLEQQHEHTGQVVVRALGGKSTYVTFILAEPV